jgi:hypothetical protein
LLFSTVRLSMRKAQKRSRMSAKSWARTGRLGRAAMCGFWFSPGIGADSVQKN